MSGNDVESYFMLKQYENSEKPQDKVTSDAAMIEFVGSEAGAIGYINSKTVIKEENVKVVLTIE